MKLRHLTTSALALILIAGCDDTGTDIGTEETSVEADDIAGTWTATSMLFTQTAAPNATADPVVDEGAVVALVLNANGTYTFTFVLAPENELDTGTYTTSGSTLTIDPVDDVPETFTIVRDGDSMTVSGEDTYDFGSGTEEAASMVISLTR